MDGQNTTEPEPQQDQSEERTPIDIDSELKFTGFEQPKESGIPAFIKRHKIRVALASFTVVVSMAVGILVLVSSGDDGSQTIVQQPQDATQTEEQPDDEEQIEEPQTSAIPEITKAEYSLNRNGEFYELVSDGQVWLTRSEYSWSESVSWNDWLFFASNRSASLETAPGSPGYVIGIEAFNYETKEYLAIAELTPPQWATVQNAMYVEGDYLYVPLGAYSSDGATHRCKLDEQKSCSNMELFYGGAGALSTINDSTVIVNDALGDAGIGLYKISHFDPVADTTNTIVELRSAYGIGTDLAAIASDGLVWITEVGGDESQAEDLDYDGRKFERLYAVDVAGETKFVLPAPAFPILDAVRMYDDSTNNIVFVNETQEVVFNTETKEFGSVKARVVAAEEEGEKTEIRKLLEISTKIEIPVALTLRAVQ